MQTFAEYAASKNITVFPWEDVPSLADPIYNFYMQFSDALGMGRRDNQAMILDVYVIDDVGFNAFAGSFADADVIALYRDVPLLILKLSRALISQGFILPHIRSGDVDSESVTVPGSLNDLLGAARVWDVEPLNDSKREALALKLAAYANLFIMAHEFAHIFSGHTDYSGQSLGISTIFELDEDQATAPVNFDRETLEWDADSFAQEHVLIRATEATEYVVSGRSALRIPASNSIGSMNDAIAVSYMSAAICSLFFAVDRKSSAGDASPKNHPHPAFRAAGASAMIAHNLSFRTGVDQHWFEDVLNDSAQQFLASVVKTFATPGEPKWAYNIIEAGEADGFGRLFEERTELWNETWEKLHPSLNTFKRGPHIAPARPKQHPAFPAGPTLG